MRSVLGIFLAALMLQACAGKQARNNVLYPALRVAYEDMQEYIAIGLADGVESEEIVEGVAEARRRDSVTLGLMLDNEDSAAASFWFSLRPWAFRGVDKLLEDEEISEGVAEEIRESIDQFTVGMGKL